MSFTKTDRLVLCRQTVAVSCANRTEDINILCGRNVGFMLRHTVYRSAPIFLGVNEVGLILVTGIGSVFDRLACRTETFCCVEYCLERDERAVSAPLLYCLTGFRVFFSVPPHEIGLRLSD